MTRLNHLQLKKYRSCKAESSQQKHIEAMIFAQELI